MPDPVRKHSHDVAVALPAKIVALLDTFAERMGKSREQLACVALLSYLEDAEDGLAAEAAEREWEAAGRPVISLDELLKRYGLES